MKAKKQQKNVLKNWNKELKKNSPWALSSAPSSKLLDKPYGNFESLKIHSRGL